jgi:hypothetical protein
VLHFSPCFMLGVYASAGHTQHMQQPIGHMGHGALQLGRGWCQRRFFDTLLLLSAQHGQLSATTTGCYTSVDAGACARAATQHLQQQQLMLKLC